MAQRRVECLLPYCTWQTVRGPHESQSRVGKLSRARQQVLVAGCAWLNTCSLSNDRNTQHNALTPTPPSAILLPLPPPTAPTDLSTCVCFSTLCARTPLPVQCISCGSDLGPDCTRSFTTWDLALTHVTSSILSLVVLLVPDCVWHHLDRVHC